MENIILNFSNITFFFVFFAWACFLRRTRRTSHRPHITVEAQISHGQGWNIDTPESVHRHLQRLDNCRANDGRMCDGNRVLYSSLFLHPASDPGDQAFKRLSSMGSGARIAQPRKDSILVLGLD
jgi:hypothetical protein